MMRFEEFHKKFKSDILMKKSIIFAPLLAICFQFQATAQDFAGSFTEEFNTLTVSNFNYGSGGSNAAVKRQIGVESEIEAGTLVARIAMDTADAASPWQGPNYTSKRLTKFGRYSARLKIPNVVESQPLVGGVVGFFTYYNDAYNSELPKDENENGLSDNSEIDFEWLIANPRLIYMTAWTDHNDDASNACKKIARIVDLAAGRILTTNYSEKVGGASTPLTGAENQPASIKAIAGFDASKNFYTYGFDWKTDNIRWWIIHPETSDTVVLWDYRGNGNNDRITQKPAFLMFNIWHTNDWSAEGVRGSTQKPKDIFAAEFDWIKYERLEDIDGGARVLRQTSRKNSNGVIRSVRRRSGETVLRFNDVHDAGVFVYAVNGKMLFKGRILNNECAIPDFPQTRVVAVRRNGRVIGQARL